MKTLFIARNAKGYGKDEVWLYESKPTLGKDGEYTGESIGMVYNCLETPFCTCDKLGIELGECYALSPTNMKD